MDAVRNSVKAVIIRDNKLLCIRVKDQRGHFFLLPGGGQSKNETFIDALKRECLEELGARVKVNSLLHIREYIACHHEFRDTDDNHQVEFMFHCELETEPDLSKASQLDNRQDGIEWIDLHDDALRVYPKVLLERLRKGDTEIYWGDVN